MESSTRVQILDEAVSLGANAFGKAWIRLFLIEYVVGQSGFFNLGWANKLLEKENFEFKPSLLCLKIGLVKHPICGVGIR